jgi:hypothetical protein
MTTQHRTHSRRAAFFELAREYEWWIAFGASTVAFVLGWIGFSQRGSALNAAYQSLQLFVLQSGAIEEPGLWLEIARWLAPSSIAYAAIKGVLMISRDQLQALTMKSYRHHVIICGLGQKGARVARAFLSAQDDPRKVVIIEHNPSNELISAFREMGAIVIPQSAADAAVLRRARLESAAYLVCVTGDDVTNLDVAEKARDIKRGRGIAGSTLTCLVHISDAQIKRSARHHELFNRNVTTIDVRLFNTYESGARALCQEFPLDVFQPVCHIDDPPPHALVVGFGRFGAEVVLQLARTAHYINTAKTNVTVVDDNADVLARRFLAQYPRITETIDLRFISESPQYFQPSALARITQHRPLSVCYLCVDANQDELAAYFQIESLFAQHNIPVVVCVLQTSGISTLLENRLHDSFHPECHIFHVFDHACSRGNLFNPWLDRYARRFHAGYLAEEKKRDAARAIAAPIEERRKAYRKRSLEEWDNLDEEYRDASRSLADHIDIKLRAAECVRASLEDPRPECTLADDPVLLEHLGRMEHARWCADRYLAGWQYGEQRDDGRRIHNSLVAWGELPREIRQNDMDMVLRIPGILAQENEKIIKRTTVT